MIFFRPRNGKWILDVAGDLSRDPSPEDAKTKMWLNGVCLALLPFGYGVWCLVTGRAPMFGLREGLGANGSGAVALAIAGMSAGLFAHFHWFWGLHPRIGGLSYLGKMVSLATFLCSFAFAMYKLMET